MGDCGTAILADLSFSCANTRYVPSGAAYLITHDRSLAEEVVQAAFVKAYERIATFDPERAFGPWFFQIVLNDAIKATNRRERSISLREYEDADESQFVTVLRDLAPGPADVWERAESTEEVLAALRQLTALQRAAVVARYYLDWSEARMAKEFNCSPNAVKWRLHAARERLRLLLRPAIPE